jgi:cytochrome c
MRLSGLTLAAVGLAFGLCACGKPQTAAPAADTQASAPAATPSDADKKALLAKLPAPYNTADLDNGAAKFALCAACHTLTQGGPNMTGPNLYGVFGRKTASIDKFTYSDPMKAANWTWDATHIDSWITNPQAVLPGSKMTFAGIADPKDRADLIAYLMTETGFKP